MKPMGSYFQSGSRESFRAVIVSVTDRGTPLELLEKSKDQLSTVLYDAYTTLLKEVPPCVTFSVLLKRQDNSTLAVNAKPIR